MEIEELKDDVDTLINAWIEAKNNNTKVLADSLVNYIANKLNKPCVINAVCDHRYHSKSGRYMLYEDWCEKCGTDISQIDC